MQPLRVQGGTGFFVSITCGSKGAASCLKGITPGGPGAGSAREPRQGNKDKTMKHPVDVHVGKRIRHRRWMTGTTQQNLADKVGIKFQQIQKYETGMNRVSASRLWDIAHALGVDIAFFFEGYDGDLNDMPGATGLPGDVLADKEALDLLRSYYAIPENQRRRLF